MGREVDWADRERNMDVPNPEKNEVMGWIVESRDINLGRQGPR